ncbi:MAG TPA: transcriptional regulator NrdR [Gammaproteobacteria bacterium]|nr:transcriptional regulator NrdR [Gammaproteobacteria bacterium]
MHCPFCNTEDTKVIDSRLSMEGDGVRRRRECLNCHERFTTFERAELRFPSIKKSNGKREDFSEEKLRRGMQRALQKRPVDTDSIDHAVSRILHKLITAGEREIDSSQLGEWVIEELAQLDDVAYVRFASVYRRFQDLDAFRKELDLLKGRDNSKRARLSVLKTNKKS